ncbi:hypothetical protein CRH01_05610 [Chryseobacterium rhizosphaerae]|nr:hypothetical protein CRH01_05610 [Chryseobacterium rhizosphaerae]
MVLRIQEVFRNLHFFIILYLIDVFSRTGPLSKFHSLQKTLFVLLVGYVKVNLIACVKVDRLAETYDDLDRYKI